MKVKHGWGRSMSVSANQGKCMPFLQVGPDSFRSIGYERTIIVLTEHIGVVVEILSSCSWCWRNSHTRKRDSDTMRWDLQLCKFHFSRPHSSNCVIFSPSVIRISSYIKRKNFLHGGALKKWLIYKHTTFFMPITIESSGIQSKDFFLILYSIFSLKFL